MPGQANTVSVTTAPLNSSAKSSASTVINGKSALGRACPIKTPDSGRPRARPARTKFLPSVSLKDARM